jgi:hypothetical protein
MYFVSSNKMSMSTPSCESCFEHRVFLVGRLQQGRVTGYERSDVGKDE